MSVVTKLVYFGLVECAGCICIKGSSVCSVGKRFESVGSNRLIEESGKKQWLFSGLQWIWKIFWGKKIACVFFKRYLNILCKKGLLKRQKHLLTVLA